MRNSQDYFYIEANSNSQFFKLHESTFKVVIVFLFVFIEVHRYIISLRTNTSKFKNDYIDISIKISKTESQLIRIMESSNPMISMDYLKRFKQAVQPVVFTRLSSTSSGIDFFNSYRGRRVTTSKQVQFTFDKDLAIPIDEICQEITGIFDAIACIRWLREKQVIQTLLR